MAIADRDTYHTPPDNRPTLLARVSPWPELVFYAPVLRVVLRSSLQAIRGRYGPEQWVEASLGIIRAMEGVGMRLSIEGMENLRKFDGAAVFMANHMSTLETFVLPSIIQPLKPVTFVVKDSLLRYPVFGPIMRSRDPVAVGRKNPREDLVAVLKGGEERLRRGISIIVFPQGTRFPKVEAGQFNTLSAKLAARAGVPLVPIALMSDAWGSGKVLRDFGRVDPAKPVRFRFGEPFPCDGKGVRAHTAGLDFILSTLDEWDRRDRTLNQERR